jgi:ribosome-binding factor A
MTASKRIERVNDLIRAELSDLLRRKVKYPRVVSASVTAVRTTPDLRHATVLVSVLDPTAEQQALTGLGRAAGFLRGELGRRLRLKTAPELVFKLDHASADAVRVMELMESLEHEET